MDIDYSAYFPEPTPLWRAAIVEFTWGPRHLAPEIAPLKSI
jgi:hypothetical protein